MEEDMKKYNLLVSKWVVLLTIILVLSFAMGACQPAATDQPAPAQETTQPQAPAETQALEPAQTEEAQPAATEEAASPTEPPTPKKDVLVIGTDISDTRFLDPHRQFDYSPPLTVRAAYETLVTFDAGNYVDLKPLLAESWELVEDGAAWQFKLRSDVKFSSGNPFTADDVKYSFDRVLNLKDTPSDLASVIAKTEVVDPLTVKVYPANKNEPLVNTLTSPTFIIMDSKLVTENGGVSEPGADASDKATEFLDQNSAGTGPYVMTRWERNTEIDLEANPNYWRGVPPFNRVIIRHIGDSAVQLLSIERGDIDVALNLTPEQLATLESNQNVSLLENISMDFMYMTMTTDPALNEGLSHKEARQAIAYAIDYNGIIDGLLGGFAVRPANFIPVGLNGSTEEMTKDFGYKEDLEKSKQLLTEAGLPDGFSFDMNFANAAIAGTNYQLIAQKIQSDLARVGITANLAPMDLTTMVTAFRAAETTSVITFWNPDAADPYLWAFPAVGRVAKRVRWTPPQELTDMVIAAGTETDPVKQAQIYEEYTRALVDQCVYIVLFQPIYRVAALNTITGWEPNAAGWYVDIFNVKPAQ
jgi:peptide/nickel transport system substrate-binding protein